MKTASVKLTTAVVRGKSHTRYTLTNPETQQPTEPLRLREMYQLAEQRGWKLDFTSEKPDEAL